MPSRDVIPRGRFGSPVSFAQSVNALRRGMAFQVENFCDAFLDGLPP